MVPLGSVDDGDQVFYLDGDAYRRLDAAAYAKITTPNARL